MTSGNKEKKFKRKTAEMHLDILMRNVRVYNANPFNPYMFTDIVVFGSYVNEPQKQMLGDLDVGFRIEKRYQDDAFKVCREMAQEAAIAQMPSLANLPYSVDICTEYALKYIKHGSGYVSLHRISPVEGEGENPYIFSKAVKNMDVGEIARMPPEEMAAMRG